MQLNACFSSDVPVLVYHKVDTRWELGVTWITPRQFEAHVKYLSKNGYRSLWCSELLENPVISPAVVITFDDAYQGFYQYALPVLRKYSFKATVFAISDYIGELNRWDAVLAERYFKHLSRDQLRELDSSGLVEFGSHGVNHHDLTTLSNDRMHYELAHSKEILEDILQHEVHCFSYPFGRYNEQVKRMAQHCNYRMAFTLVQGKGDSLFNIRRSALYRTDNLAMLRVKLREPAWSYWSWYDHYRGKIINGFSRLSKHYLRLLKRNEKHATLFQ